MSENLHHVLKLQLLDIDAGWSIGSFGAIGEFHQRPCDILSLDDPDQLIRVSEKGGLRLIPGRLADVTPIAYETLSRHPQRWGQGLALCLPDNKAVAARRSVLTELGPDTDALKPEDRDGVLFDMGLDQPQIDFCIRTCDPKLLSVLRAQTGRSLFEPDNPAMSAILNAHPARVVISPLGRVEVYQMIGGPDTGGVSPDGPHTHVLPNLLRVNRTHSANTLIPDGLIPCAYLHPASPVMGHRGEDIPFDTGRFVAFQALLDRFGLPEYVATKTEVLSALEASRGDALSEPETRVKRVALRNTLRQQARLAELTNDEARTQLCALLMRQFDRSAAAGQDPDLDLDADPDRPGHEGERS
ncbi:hypothetical protein JM93_03468 [Roseibium hamelinense]|uniref:Uncharacterized protein n=1 Tax=Roseibium hamelinense TaxID=150831 RepID=A0A562SP48_9HYPH|nr:hypothetical protein [Roseibium hamelinense]MTI44274.1 hypothetical protein [Roseibium hamelinense]TWI82953.1 hypothetical protein JM93_03468 [Roseibium hamelinense]